jgi:hypothetical protein
MPQTPKKRHGTICQMIAGVVAFRRNRTKTTLTFSYPSAGAGMSIRTWNGWIDYKNVEFATLPALAPRP